MADTIKVNPELLNSTAGEFSTQASSLQGITNQMVELINSTSSIWQGDAQAAYAAKFSQLQDDMDKMFRMVQEHSSDLQTMAQNYISAENENSEIANALSADVIA